jgi:hypothetical protein
MAGLIGQNPLGRWVAPDTNGQRWHGDHFRVHDSIQADARGHFYCPFFVNPLEMSLHEKKPKEKT